MKSDILNNHLTHLIHIIDDSINSLNVNACYTLGGQIHGVKVSTDSTLPCTKAYVFSPPPFSNIIGLDKHNI